MGYKIIVTMAGLGNRFKKIGIKKPKHEIVARDRTLFEWSMISLKDFFDKEFIFICRTESFNEKFIKSICEKIGINKYRFIVLSQITDGQATTAHMADKYIKDNEGCIIYNIDTYVKPYKILQTDILNEYDGFIPVIRAEGNRWSFVKTDDSGKVIDIAEKKPISNLATIGLYYFKSWKKYKEIYNRDYNKIRQLNKEIYIAPMYKRMINENLNIGIKILDKSDVFILGTPKEIDTFDSNYFLNNR